MKSSELLVEHRYNNRFIQRRRLKASSSHAYVIGSSPSADLRLLGEDVGGIHALLEYSSGEWRAIDCSIEGETSISSESFCERAIESGDDISIGGHKLKLVILNSDRQLFSQSKSESNAHDKTPPARGTVFQQVVVSINGEVLQTEIIGKKRPFRFLHGKSIHKLEAPQGPEWKETQIGRFTIRQRLTTSQQQIPEISFSLKTLMSKDFRAPVLAMVIALLLLVSLFFYGLTHQSAEVIKIVQLQNPYTKLIYDAKMTKQAKAQSQILSKQFDNQLTAGKKGPGVPHTREGGINAVNHRIIKQIRASNLSSLIGRISARASINAIQFQEYGNTKKGEHGPVGSVGAAAKAAGAVVGKPGGHGLFKIGGVGTLGKGGGVRFGSGYAGIGAGSVGKGTVSVVEEGAEVSGGLSRDVIAQYINSHLGEIRYCYERQLSANPSLYGKIKVRFVIAPTGRVVEQAVASATLDSVMVQGCILRRISEWDFPHPKGGTSVVVTYPFLFRSTN